MSFSTKAAPDSPYVLMNIGESPIHTLTVPGSNEKPDEHIVYFSQKLFKEGIFAFKPITTLNQKSLLNEEKIKKSQRLVTIQFCSDGIYLSWNKKFDTDEAFDLILKLNQKQLLSLGPVHNFVQLTDVGYERIDAIYAKYLDDMYAKLTAAKAQRENGGNNNNAVQNAPHDAKKQESKCVIC